MCMGVCVCVCEKSWKSVKKDLYDFYMVWEAEQAQRHGYNMCCCLYFAIRRNNTSDSLWSVSFFSLLILEHYTYGSGLQLRMDKQREPSLRNMARRFSLSLCVFAVCIAERVGNLIIGMPFRKRVYCHFLCCVVWSTAFDQSDVRCVFVYLFVGKEKTTTTKTSSVFLLYMRDLRKVIGCWKLLLCVYMKVSYQYAEILLGLWSANDNNGFPL